MGLAIFSLWHRELVRFLTDRSRLFSSIGQPVIFWVLFAGALSGSNFKPGELSYGEFFWVGGLTMTLLFTAIFSTITVIEDRKEGFLQSVLVSPVPRSSIVLGKILGCTTLAMFNGLLFFALLPLAGVSVSVESFLSTVGVMFILAMALVGMGYSLAWLMDSSAGYHGVMMVLFMPMLLLSGAFFPVQTAHWILKWIMMVNPLAYGVGALRHTLYPTNELAVEGLPSLTLCLAVSVAFALTMFALSTMITMRRTARDAQ